MSIHGLYKILERGGNASEFDALLNQKAVQGQLSARNNKALFLAIQLGNLKFVEALLKFPSVRQNIACNNNQCFVGAVKNLAHEISTADNKAIVLTLLGYKGVKEKIDAGQNAALRWAVRCGDLDLVNELLSFEKVCQNVGLRRFEAFHWALEENHLLIAERLLELPQVQAALRGGHSYFLRRIFELGNTALCRQVLQIEGVPAAIVRLGCKIFKGAINSGNLDIVNLLIAVPGIHLLLTEDDDFGMDSVEAACKIGAMPILERFLAFPHVRDHLLETVALETASFYGHLEILTRLLEWEWEEDALSWAAESAAIKGHHEILKKLLESPFLVNGVSHHKNYFLRKACHYSQYKTARLLLEYPTVRAELQNSGWDVLLCACRHDAVDILKELLKHPEARSHAADVSNSLLRIAVKNRYDEIADALLECACVRKNISEVMMPMNLNLVHMALNQRRKTKGDDIAARLVRAGFPIELLSKADRRVSEIILVAPHTALAINRRKPKEVQAEPFNLTQKDLKTKVGQIKYAAGILAHPKCGVDIAQKIASFLPLMSMQKARKLITTIDNSHAEPEPTKKDRTRKKK